MFKFAHLPRLILLLLLPVASSIAATTFTLPSGEVLRDPTRPAAAQAQPKGAGVRAVYKLNYIFASASRRQAIINGRTLSVGDRLGQAKVIDIAPDQVVIVEAGQRQILRLKPAASFKTRRQ